MGECYREGHSSAPSGAVEFCWNLLRVLRCSEQHRATRSYSLGAPAGRKARSEERGGRGAVRSGAGKTAKATGYERYEPVLLAEFQSEEKWPVAVFFCAGA